MRADVILVCICVVMSACESLMCDHLRHRYYHKQAKQCMDCDLCVPGEGVIPFKDGMDLRFDPHGATLCLPCRKCEGGTYSDRRSYDCDACTNCTAQDKVEIQRCTHLLDAVCGGKIYTTREMDNGVLQPKSIYRRRKRYVASGKTESKGRIVGIAAAVTLLIFVGIFIFLVCKIQRRPCRIPRRHHPNVRSAREVHELQPLNEDSARNVQDTDAHTEDEVRIVQQPSTSSLTTYSEGGDVFGQSSETETWEQQMNPTNISDVKPKRTRFWYRGDKSERAPLIPKRKRYQSCTVDYGTNRSNKGHVNPLMSVINDNEIGTPVHLTATFQGQDNRQNTKCTLNRQHSFPMSAEELNLIHRDKAYEFGSVPSIKFCSYFSKLTTKNFVFKKVAVDNGVDLNTVNEIHRKFIGESLREVAYRVAVKLCEMKVTKAKIYESLERFQQTEILNALQLYDLKTTLNEV